MGDGLRLALTTLTVARVRGPRELDRRTAGAAMSLAPLVGLLLGLVVGLVLVVLRELAPYRAGPVLPVVLAVALLALLTRGLHLDGLADTVDGLASYLPAEQARRVMKAPDVGALGLVAVVLTLLAQVAALYACVVSGRGTASLLVALVTARVAVSAACTPSTPAATTTGMGALVAGTVRREVPLVLAALTALGGAVYESLDEGGTAAARIVDVLRPVLAVTAGLLAARALRRHAVRRLGGLTGDVLGALVEVTTTVVLVVMATDLPVRVQVATGWLQKP